MALGVMTIREHLVDFSEQFEPEYRMKINFGIHTGAAVVGNIGSQQIMNFTAVGDTVNVAARLQGISRGGQILISEVTHNLLDGQVNAQLVGSRNVKGRSEPVMIYEVMA